MNTSTMKILRYSVAFVFIVSGLMKLISPELEAFFINLGLPYPLTLMYITAATEITCGAFLVANKYVKKAAMPLIGIIIAAILLTKVPSMSKSIIQATFNARLDIVLLILLFIIYQRPLDEPYKE